MHQLSYLWWNTSYYHQHTRLPQVNAEGRSLIKHMNNNGPRLDPCGMPDVEWYKNEENPL
jgi:hypothetical protein